MIGKELICVDDSIPAEHFLSICSLYPNWIKKGRKYTVRDFYLLQGNEIGILLVEVQNPLSETIIKGRSIEPAFNLKRFREPQIQELEEPSFNSHELLGVW
jgi:hypothetical protein